MQQIWINGKNGYILANYHLAKTCSDTCYLLIQGLFEPQCDLNYFYQEFVEEIKITSFSCLSFDFEGTGDSYSEMDKVSFDVFLSNINTIIQFLERENFKHIIAIGRGIGANLLLKILTNPLIDKIVMVNPLLLSEKTLSILTNFVASYSYKYVKLTTNVLIELKGILYMSGVDMSNIEDEIIPKSFFIEMLRNKALFLLDLKEIIKTHMIYLTKDISNYYDSSFVSYISGYDFSNYSSRYSLIRDILNLTR